MITTNQKENWLGRIRLIFEQINTQTAVWNELSSSMKVPLYNTWGMRDDQILSKEADESSSSADQEPLNSIKALPSLKKSR